MSLESDHLAETLFDGLSDYGVCTMIRETLQGMMCACELDKADALGVMFSVLTEYQLCRAGTALTNVAEKVELGDEERVLYKAATLTVAAELQKRGIDSFD